MSAEDPLKGIPMPGRAEMSPDINEERVEFVFRYAIDSLAAMEQHFGELIASYPEGADMEEYIDLFHKDVMWEEFSKERDYEDNQQMLIDLGYVFRDMIYDAVRASEKGLGTEGYLDLLKKLANNDGLGRYFPERAPEHMDEDHSTELSMIVDKLCEGDWLLPLARIVERIHENGILER